MRTRTSFLILGGIAGVGVIMAGVLLFLASQRVPRIPQPTANRNPIIANVEFPHNGGSYPNNGTLPVTVALDSQKPIQLVQVWLDGQLVTDAVPPKGAKFENINLPGSILTGDNLHTLVVTAVDLDGRSTPGNVVRVKGLPPIPAAFVIRTTGGESLQSIAARFNQDLSRVMGGNPQLIMSLKIDTGAESLPAGSRVIVPLSPPAPQAPEKPAGKTHQINYSPDVPLPPAISTNPQGCDVGVSIGGPSSKADGYTLYRLNPDSAQFVKVVDIKTSGKSTPLTLQDHDAHGSAEYYVSAYNSKGETLSALANVDLTDPACQSASDLSVTDGILHLPAGIDRVYLYVSVNSGEYDRWPKKQGDFLSPENDSLDLHQYTDTLVNSNTYTNYPFSLDMEVWGWSSGQLQFLGKVSARLDASNLTICDYTAGQCTGDVQGSLNVKSIVIDSLGSDQVRSLNWWTTIPHNATVLFQLTSSPFSTQYDLNPPGLVYSQLVSGEGGDTSSSGTFDVDFSKLHQAANLSQQLNPNLSLSKMVIHQPGGPDPYSWLSSNLGWAQLTAGANYELLSNIPVIYYGRIIPMNGNQPSGPISNIITIKYQAIAPQPTIQMINDVPPHIFEVKLNSFNPPTAPVFWWGCVDIVGIDPNASSWQLPYWSEMLPQFQQALNNPNLAYCPTGWKGVGEPPWYEQLWDFISGGLSWISKAYDSIKSAVVSFVADAINGIPPGGLCKDSCKGWLNEGLNAGLAALGIPPELPDLNKLTDEGLNYLIQEGASQMTGVDCSEDSPCWNDLSTGLNDLRDQMRSQEISSYADADTAHNHGFNPLPLPADGLAVVPDPRDNWQMATATLTLTRSPDSGQYTMQSLRKYKYLVQVGMLGRNDWMIGKTIPVYTALCYNDASMWPCGERDDPVDQELEAGLFNGQIPLPDIDPGQSIQVNVTLVPTRWWYADHKEYSGNTWPWADDWSYLYANGKATMTADIYAAGIQAGGPFVYKISEDAPPEFDLPYLDTQGMNNPGP